MELLVHMVILCLLLKNHQTVSIVAVSFLYSNQRRKGFQLFTSLPTSAILSLFNHSHFNGPEMAPHFGFDLRFPYD